MALANMSVKLMNKGTHQCADMIGMVMAQALLKAALRDKVKDIKMNNSRLAEHCSDRLVGTMLKLNYLNKR